MRLFTAIELPKPVLDHLQRAIETLRARPQLREGISISRPENLHVTLKFLGEVDDAHLPNLITALQKLRFGEMKFAIERFIVLPGQGPARVLGANMIGDNSALLDQFMQLEATVQPLGISREARPFKPHVTVARIRRPSNRLTAQTLIRIVDPRLLPTPEFTVTQGTLFRSVLTPTGPVYAALAHFGRVADEGS